MSIFNTDAQHGGAKLALRGLVTGSVMLSTGIAAVQPALAAELVTAELVGSQNVVEVTQGRSADFTVTLSATGNAACGATSTARVKNAFSISASGLVGSGTAFSSPVSFSSPGSGNNCDITGGGTVDARVTAAAGTPLGTYTVPLSAAAGTTAVTNSNDNGGKLADGTATTLTFRVVAPVVTNRAPVSGNAPTAATGTEGSTLQSSGSFTDADGDLTSITASSGTLTADRTADDKLSGSWSWQLPTTDDVSGSVTVTATDSHGAAATQTFSYAASNVVPRTSVQAPDAAGTEGQTLATGGSFADVPGDTLTISTTSTGGTLVDNGDGSYSWSLAAGNETSGSVIVRATDDDGGFTEDTFDFSAANVAPGVRTDAQDVSGDEGSTLGNAGAFSDVPADTLTVSKTGDGTLTPGTSNGDWSWGLHGADDATGPVSVTASDGTATSSPDTFSYTVHNVAPAVAAEATDATGDEGTTLQASGRFSDVATDPLTLTKVSGPGVVTGNGDGTWSWSLEGTDDLIGDIVVQASDGDGGVTQDSFAVTVRNVAPTVADAGAADATGSEGNTLTTQGAFSDVPADILTITASSGGTLVDHRDGTWSWSRATANQTAGTVIVTASDDDGGTVTDTFDYQAVDVAPQITVAAVDASGVEGDRLTAPGSFQDVAADPITITKGSGPGTVTDNGDGTWSFGLTTVDQLVGTVEVIATADGKQTRDSFTVEAANVAPAVGAASGDQTGSEGDTLSTSGSFTDVAADPITISKDSGDGTLTLGASGAWSWNLGTTDDASGTVVIKADDGDGGITRSSFTYTANNVSPVLSALALTGSTGTACLTGNTVGLRFTVADPGSADTMGGTINWGDGQSSAFTSRSVDTTHAYAPGSYTITVNVSDDDGGAAAARTATVSRNYAISGIQAPYNADGTSVFKYGSVAPVKVRITDCTNTSVAGLSPTIRVALVSNSAPSDLVNEPADTVSAADTTGVLRYDAGSGQYIYNLSTRALSDGDARYRVTVATSSAAGAASTFQNFGLRTK